MIAADLLIQQRKIRNRPVTLISKATVGELLAIVFDVQPYESGAVVVHERRWAIGPADDKSQIALAGGLVSRRLVPIAEQDRGGRSASSLPPRPHNTTERKKG